MKPSKALIVHHKLQELVAILNRSARALPCPALIFEQGFVQLQQSNPHIAEPAKRLFRNGLQTLRNPFPLLRQPQLSQGVDTLCYDSLDAILTQSRYAYKRALQV